MSVPPRFNVLGVGVSALTLEEARDRLVAAAGTKNLGYVCLGTTHGLGEARRDPAFRTILNRSYLTTPDGMPLVWFGRRCGRRAITRVYGPDLLLAVCDAGRSAGLRHYFYGGAPGIAPELARRLSDRFPGLRIAGTFTPPFRPLDAGEFEAFRLDVATHRPDIIWVGLGTPKQERFMAAHWAKLDTGLMVGIGAAFDFHSGRVPQAPRWMQRIGLEWLFRLATEPRRLAKRYFVFNSLFLLRAFAQLTGLKKYPIE
ncbi:MAG TPA: WecB/TagA/CpsF family glycosyltransferase [Candidatus Didemnitutus sp.]|nr:WecB/TagA/CpsF family glycosyltransferase [Candidatus Didemnitutus sp.]